MDTTSRKQKVRTVTDPDLGRRIRSLREGLKLSQRDFAQILLEEAGKSSKGKISHTQISEWERGTETPAVDKLIALARLARTAEERAWFWAKAGVTEEMVRATFPELAADRIRGAKKNEVVGVPFLKRLSIDDEGAIVAHSDRSLLLPAEQFGSAPFVFCLELDVDSGKGFLFSRGDIAIIDRSPVQPRVERDDQPRPQNLMDSLVLMFFECRYEHESVSLSPEEFARLTERSKHISRGEIEREEEFIQTRFPKEHARREREFEASVERTKKWMGLPVAKIGWLRLQPAGGRWEGNFRDHLSRFALELEPSQTGYSGRSIPLTDWKKGLNPLDANVGAHVTRPNHIVGRVIGWIRQNRASVRTG